MFKKIALVILFVGLALFIAVFVTGMMGRHELAQQEKAWREMGGVFDFTEMEPAAIPDTVNAAKAYGVAFAFLDGLESEENYLLGADPAEEPGVNAVLDQCGEAIKQLRLASHMENCRWEIDYGRGFDAVFSPHGQEVRKASRLLASHAYRMSEEGRDDEVARDIEAMLRMGLHAMNDPTMTGELSAASVFGYGVSLYEELFQDHIAPENEVAEIAARYDDRAVFRMALMGEGAMSKSMLRDAMKDFGVSLPPYADFVMNWDRAYYLRQMMREVASCDHPYYEAQAVGETKVPFYAFASGQMIPAFEKAARSFALLRLRAVMLESAEELREYKTKHGEYPEVDVIEVPIDALTGKRLGYAKVGEGFRLVSEAVNGKGEQWEWVWEK